MPSVPLKLLPATYADIPALARISHESFILDRHTQMKGRGKMPFVMYDVAVVILEQSLDAKHCVCIKAVHGGTGEAIGWCCWGFRGFEANELPKGDPGEKAAYVTDNEDKSEGTDIQEEWKERNDGGHDKDDVVKRLEAMTDANMKEWVERLMPPETKCMYIRSMAVAPSSQKQGVGREMLKWGSDVADHYGVFIWVHSSEDAWKAYEKAGFEVIGTLDIDLDAWAPAPPPIEEGEGAVWGHYVFRYMKRLPKNGSKYRLMSDEVGTIIGLEPLWDGSIRRLSSTIREACE